MNKICLYLIGLMLLSSCEGIKTVRVDMEGEQLECRNEKAKAILWVDWKHGEDLSDYRIVRTAKAHVNVYSDGTFRIISFCKRNIKWSYSTQTMLYITENFIKMLLIPFYLY